MKKKLLSLLVTGLALTASPAAFAVVVDFSDATGHGVSQDTIQINGIRVDQEVENIFDPSRPTLVSSYYNVPFLFDLPTLHLIPVRGVSTSLS